MEGHVEGMLDRDQRTAKLRFFEQQESPCGFLEKASRCTSSGTPRSPRCCCPTRTRRFKPSQLACRNGYLLNTFQSVKNVLLVVCITLVAIPIVNCKPVHKMPLEDLSKDPMKWVNPCDGARVGNVPPNSNFNKTELKAIKDEADRDFNSALELTQNHIADTFKKPIEKVHQDFKDQKLEWLDMNLPKQLNETLEEGHFENKKIENVIPNVYSLLQRIAVGLEQITYDQKKSDSERVSKFEHLELEMKRLLCELQDFMAGHGHALPEDVQREIMKDEDRIGDDSTKRSRDYMILRDYMNTLQYVKMAFEYYHSIAP